MSPSRRRQALVALWGLGSVALTLTVAAAIIHSTGDLFIGIGLWPLMPVFIGAVVVSVYTAVSATVLNVRVGDEDLGGEGA